MEHILYWIFIVGCYIKTIEGQTAGGNANGDPCVFPFRYRENLYSSCILRDHDTLWCSTTKDYNTDKKWGECEAEDLKNIPVFDNTTAVNVIADIGETVRLPCTISNLGSKQVAWQKKGSKYPLTAATRSFLSNGKFIVERYGTDGWNLIIDNVQKSDRGIYLCRVTTRSMLLVREIQLSIRGYPTPPIDITEQNGWTDVALEKGLKLKLVCNTTSFQIVSGRKYTNKKIIEWYKDSTKIDSNARNGIMFLNLVRNSLFQSTLVIDEPRRSDSGNYYCSSGDKTIAKFYVHFKESPMSNDPPIYASQSVTTRAMANIPDSLKDADRSNADSVHIYLPLTVILTLLCTLATSSTGFSQLLALLT